MAKMMRIDDETHAHLERLAATTGKSKVQLMREAVFTLERQAFFVCMNQQLEHMPDNVFSADVAVWDATLSDGLEDEDFSAFESNDNDDKKTSSR